MESELISMGIISIIPAVIAIVLSFATRNTIVSLVTACIVGTLLAGQGPLGFPTLLKESLGTTSFSWVMLLNTFIAIIVAYFQKTGAIQSFSQMIHDKNLSRRGAQLMAWVLGIFVYFSDSFSPILRLLRSAFWCRLPDGLLILAVWQWESDVLPLRRRVQLCSCMQFLIMYMPFWQY